MMLKPKARARKEVPLGDPEAEAAFYTESRREEQASPLSQGRRLGIRGALLRAAGAGRLCKAGRGPGLGDRR